MHVVHSMLSRVWVLRVALGSANPCSSYRPVCEWEALAVHQLCFGLGRGITDTV